MLLFAFKLARDMHRTVEELCGSMSLAEFQQWLGFYDICPMPDPWLQTGIIASQIFNGNSVKRKLAPKDFMPSSRTKARKPQTVREMQRNLASVLSGFEHGRDR